MMINIRMQRERSLDNEGETLNRVGWFLPPFASVGSIQLLTRSITEKGSAFSQVDLQRSLSGMYSEENLAAMVTERYPIIPYVQDYKVIIEEAVEAHFCGLGHMAVAGLLPVVEGAGKQLAERMDVKFSSTAAFAELASKCKKHVQLNQIGAVGEIVSMLTSFSNFAKKTFMRIPIAMSLMTTLIVTAFCTETTRTRITACQSIFTKQSPPSILCVSYAD